MRGFFLFYFYYSRTRGYLQQKYFAQTTNLQIMFDINKKK